MKLWLGREKGREEGLKYEGLRFKRQVEGDLGRKMAVAARSMFEEEEEKEERGKEEETYVVIVGSDIPCVSRKSFHDAFHSLSLHSPPQQGERTKGCVLGPVFDGGYYLVGMNDVSLAPVLFVDTGLLFVLSVV